MLHKNPSHTSFLPESAQRAYIIPFLLAYIPLLFEGRVIQVIIAAVTDLIGLLGFTAFLEGYMLINLNIGERAIGLLATALLFWPDHLYKMEGFVIMLVLYLIQRVSVKKRVSFAHTPASS